MALMDGNVPPEFITQVRHVERIVGIRTRGEAERVGTVSLMTSLGCWTICAAVHSAPTGDAATGPVFNGGSIWRLVRIRIMVIRSYTVAGSGITLRMGKTQNMADLMGMDSDPGERLGGIQSTIIMRPIAVSLTLSCHIATAAWRRMGVEIHQAFILPSRIDEGDDIRGPCASGSREVSKVRGDFGCGILSVDVIPSILQSISEEGHSIWLSCISPPGCCHDDPLRMTFIVRIFPVDDPDIEIERPIGYLRPTGYLIEVIPHTAIGSTPNFLSKSFRV